MSALLLVDDDPDDLVAVRATLDPLGVEVVCAGSGEEALRELLRRDFAIMIMDLMMPRLNGFEVAALVRERDRCRGMPIVILTGFDEDGARGQPGWGVAGVELMRKPAVPEALRARVAAAIGAWRPPPEATPKPLQKR